MKNIIFLISFFIFISCSSDQKHEKEGNEDTSKTENNRLRRDAITYKTYSFGVSEINKNIKFDVSDVEIAKEYLVTNESHKIFENKLGKEIMFLPKEHENIQLVNTKYNGLIFAAHQCYSQHRPLVLTPDLIWLAITQGVSIHINKNFKTLKNKIFKPNKPKKLIVRNDSLSYGSEHWEDLINSLANKTSKYTNEDFYSFFVPNFSTTTQVNTTAYQINLLNSYKKAFAYVGESGCGIPYIRITGEKKDWELIYSNLDLLDDVGMEDWKIILKPIIKEFINVYDNNINKKFWQNIYKDMIDYNAFYITGWIIKLFPYLEGMKGDGVIDEEKDCMRFKKYYYKNKFIYGDKMLLSNLSTDDFPSGIVDIDLTWKNYIEKETKKLKIYSGFFGIKQYEDKSLETIISWAICEEKAKNVEHSLNVKHFPYLVENKEFWTPYVVEEELLKKAIYNQRKFKNSEESINFIKTNLQDTLKSYFKNLEFKNDTLKFVVLVNGKIENVEYTGKEKVKDFIEDYLNNLEYNWFPALADPKKVFDMWSEVGDKSTKQIKVNSRIIIPL